MSGKKENILKIARGELGDRVPVSLWRHFYDQETSAEGLARAMIAFQKKHDWDFMKVNPRACYHAQTFGVEYRMSADPAKNHERIGSPMQTPADWLKMKPVSHNEGPLAEQLQALRLIKNEMGDELFIIQTVFHPFSIASDLLESPGDMVPLYHDHWPKIKNGLEVITETFRNYVRAMIKERLVDGIFFAIKDWGTSDIISDDEYARTARAYDLAVLEEVADARFNLLHVCKSNNRLFSFLDYPVQGLNWDASDPTNPGIRDASQKTDKLLIGGVAHRGKMLSGSVEDVKREVEGTLKEAEGLRFILGAGCTISVETPEGNARAFRESVGRSGCH